MANRADQAGLRVQDIARASQTHRHKLDAKTRAAIANRCEDISHTGGHRESVRRHLSNQRESSEGRSEGKRPSSHPPVELDAAIRM